MFYQLFTSVFLCSWWHCLPSALEDWQAEAAAAELEPLEGAGTSATWSPSISSGLSPPGSPLSPAPRHRPDIGPSGPRLPEMTLSGPGVCADGRAQG